MIDCLARGLVAAGHEVVLFATGDSTCPVPLEWTYAVPIGIGSSSQAEDHHVQVAYESLTNRVDVIHDHTLSGPRRLLSRPSATPVVATNHVAFTPEVRRWWEPIGRRLPVVAVSHAHAASAPTVTVRKVIHHGIDMTGMPLGHGEGGYVAFLGRMSPDKGPHRAISVARAAGVPIKLAAKMSEPGERVFFRDVVQPLLGPDAVFVGEVGGQEKTDFLRGAIALLNPIRWTEPFGLVMIEAMAHGTPVLAFAEGAAPEIVANGVNGFLCADEAAMVEAMSWAQSLDRRQCRASIETRFGVHRMVEDHVRLYKDVAADWERYERTGRQDSLLTR
jgi:glycosyltransferase involved in cell wall biosynthesis